MSNAATHDLVQRVTELLRPGDISLAGMIVHTEYTRNEEIEMHQATVEIGELIVEHAGVTGWYVYSGNDSPEFGANQHQGLRLEDDGFVWECQQLVRGGTFDVVMYYEASIDQDALVAVVEDAGFDVTPVECPD